MKALCPFRKGAAAAKLDIEMDCVIIEVVNAHPDYSLRMINTEIRTILPGSPWVSLSTTGTYLHGQLITMKKHEDMPAGKKSERTRNHRNEHAGMANGKPTTL